MEQPRQRLPKRAFTPPPRAAAPRRECFKYFEHTELNSVELYDICSAVLPFDDRRHCLIHHVDIFKGLEDRIVVIPWITRA